MSIFLNCKKANHSCDKSQYKEASLLELIKLNIHLLYCLACRKYAAKNTKLSNAFKKADLKTMPAQTKAILKERLRQEIAK
tara:strand:+ start:23579 stop:23821 length:243 start_codon:yes stop_codon:yes gene_type:complete